MGSRRHAQCTLGARLLDVYKRQEAGQTALAGRVELAGKVAVLLAAMPLFTVLTDTLLALLR